VEVRAVATVFPNDAAVAVSLSFDDARASQLAGARILEEHGIRASFYVLPSGIAAAADGWRAVAAAGHELGNHTNTHPCSANFEFSRANALEDMTMPDIAADIDAASRAIAELLGVVPRTFAYPCGQAFIGRGSQRRSYVPLVADRFVAGRGYASETGNQPDLCDLAHLDAYVIDGLDSDTLESFVDAGITRGEWVILAGHDIGPRAHQTVPADELDRFCRRLARDDRIWVAPIVEVAELIRATPNRQSDLVNAGPDNLTLSHGGDA
jgi:peptidoglycan-N-acetylglucosamine deacetylase